jgi:uncharacterized protein
MSLPSAKVTRAPYAIDEGNKMLELFPRHEVVGVFRGFREGGLEFHADLVLPYRPKLHNTPMHGQFLLVQLEHPNEAVLGRITSLSADGRLTSGAGEQYSIRSVSEGRQVPDHLREEYLKYRVDIRVLGVIRLDDDYEITFVPSHRRLPHVGSPVAFLADDLLPHIAGHHSEGAEIGFFALGEYIYAQGDDRLAVTPWMQIKSPCVTVKFPVQNLVSRRTFIFARAGFGKSNLNKLLFSMLYTTTPTVPKRGGREVPVGTIVFDPDGEYFWPDDKGRPGLCDVAALQDQIVVFTSRQAPSPFYDSFVAGTVKLDIRRLRPSDVVTIALPSDRQEQQNVRKLRGMNLSDWSDLVDFIDAHGNSADLHRIQELLHLESNQEVEALAARANMTAIVRMLHDRHSQLMDILLEALAEGKLCIVDVSQLRGGPSLILSGLILRRIFDRNQEEFTKAEPKTIPIIAVVEEAQAVLNETASASTPYIEWVKEGRKYDLGAVLITQQPGAIPTEILSQGDNWFVFHLLSAADLQSLQRANAHFSGDLLSVLLNEPITGQGIFWSSAGQTIYPIPLRVLSFEHLYERLDKEYDRPAIAIYASQLREKYASNLAHLLATVTPLSGMASAITPELEVAHNGFAEPSQAVDPFRLHQEQAIEMLKTNEEFMQELAQNGVPWGKVVGLLKEELPATMDDRDAVAYNLVPKAITEILGKRDEAWKTERRGPRGTLFIVKM